MKKPFTARAEVDVKAAPGKVWEALTRPEIVKQYFFGTELVTDWKVGSRIIYRGRWEGKPYEDKGHVLQFEPERLLVCDYWSAFSGNADLPEHYHEVRYELAPSGPFTRLTVTQDNIATDEIKTASEGNWALVLAGLKKLLEGGADT